MSDYAEIARAARLKCLDLIFRAQTSHIGSNFSCIDILTVLFEKVDLDKDKFVLSAGWKAASLYYFLWRKGRITEEQLNSYCQAGSPFVGLAEPIIPEIPIAGGSMSLGLAGACGLALAKRLRSEDGRVYVLESDGGLQGGPTWEALSIAGHRRLNNLTLVVDANSLQAMGRTEEILTVEPLAQRLKSLYWNVYQVDGHDHLEVGTALKRTGARPTAIIARTIKGYPVSFMCDQNFYHYAQLTPKMYRAARKELV